jgi:hypothetical protein
MYGGPVATTLVCFFIFAREAAGVGSAPGFPCALHFQEDDVLNLSGASAARTRTLVCLAV